MHRIRKIKEKTKEEAYTKTRYTTMKQYITLLYSSLMLVVMMLFLCKFF